MTKTAVSAIQISDIEAACGRSLTIGERSLLHIGVDPGMSGAIAAISLRGRRFLSVQKLGEDVNMWPDIVESFYTKPATTLVETPQLSRGKASFNAGVIYGLCMYAAMNVGFSMPPGLVHPNTIKKCVTEMLGNLKKAKVEIVYPHGDEDYGNKHDRIVLASTICGTTNLFRRTTGTIDDNMTDAVCHALVSLYMYGGFNE